MLNIFFVMNYGFFILWEFSMISIISDYFFFKNVFNGNYVIMVYMKCNASSRGR